LLAYLRDLLLQGGDVADLSQPVVEQFLSPGALFLGTLAGGRDPDRRLPGTIASNAGMKKAVPMPYAATTATPWAFICRRERPPTPAVARELVAATLGMIGGQQLDLEGGVELQQLHSLKTGSLFSAAVMCALWAAEEPA